MQRRCSVMVKNQHMIERQRWPRVSSLTHGEILMEKHVDGQREACYSEMLAVNVYGCLEVISTKKLEAQ